MMSNSAESINALSRSTGKLPMTFSSNWFRNGILNNDNSKECYQWAMDWFTIEVHAATYAESIQPVPDESEWEIDENDDKLKTPYMDKRQVGRPRENKRIPSRGDEIGLTIC